MHVFFMITVNFGLKKKYCGPYVVISQWNHSLKQPQYFNGFLKVDFTLCLIGPTEKSKFFLLYLYVSIFYKIVIAVQMLEGINCERHIMYC